MEVRNIKIEEIYAHPKNPRKDLGDITELADSIKKNGVMQNMTVIPGHWDEAGVFQPDGFTLLIGHRRCAAAKIAGLKVVPCRIVKGMDEKEQVGIMLVENMQRSDLTVFEQAQSFQMMLDLGETEDSIADKTGFSKTTVRHRLNIAKLDQNLLQQKNSDESFQLSIFHLYSLEQVKDIEVRNKILREASNSRELVHKALSAVEQEKRDANADIIISMLKNIGVEEAPDKVRQNYYSSKYETLETFYLDNKPPKSLPKKKLENAMYIKNANIIRVLRVKPKEEKVLSQREIDEKTLKSLVKDMAKEREACVRNILSGKIAPIKDTKEIIEKLWKVMLMQNCYGVSVISVAKFVAGEKGNWYSLSEEVRAKAKQDLANTSFLHQLLIASYLATAETVLHDYRNAYRKEAGAAVTMVTEVLHEYGFTYSDDVYNKVMEGTHPCYTKEAN